MKTNKSPLILYSALVVTFTSIVLSLFSSSDMMETVKTAVLSIPLIVYLYDIRTGEMKKKAFVLLTASALFFVTAFIDAFISDDAPFTPSLIKSLSALFYLVPLTAITFTSGKMRIQRALITGIHILITLPALRYTAGTYEYLYAGTADYPSYLTYSTFLALALILTALSEIVFNTNKNYLSDALLLSAACFSYSAAKAEGLEKPILSPYILIMLLILFIYIAREEKVRYTPEVRKIVLSTLKTQEIEPLRRKKKPREYEIPPNVPVNDTENDGG